MSRDLAGINDSDLSASVIRPFFAIDLLFASGALYLWTGLGQQEFNGNTYSGTGQMMSISSIEESSMISAKGATLVMSGVPSEMLSLALQEAFQGRLCKIYFGMYYESASILKEDGDLLLTEAGGNLLTETGSAGFVEIFTGFMDQMNIDEGPDTATVSMTIENKLIDLERPRVARYTSAFQKATYPNDKGLDFIEDLQDKKTPWGRASE